ncbi:hypothetical protein ABK040_000627 [Willaertia magna]
MKKRNKNPLILSEILEKNRTLFCENTEKKKNEILLKTHEHFLSELKINENLNIFNYWECVLEIISIAYQFTCCCFFSVLFYVMLEMNSIVEQMKEKTIFIIWRNSTIPEIEYSLLLFSGVLIFICFFWWKFIQKDIDTFGNEKTIPFASSLIVTLILLGASPILRTLTLTYSTDTIIAMVVLLFIIHLLTHDYHYVNGHHDRYNCYLSLNCVILISALLASRLPSSLESFLVLSFAIELFLLFPFLRHHLRKFNYFITYLLIFILMFIITCVGIFIFIQSFFLFTTFILINIILVFVMPLIFTYSQKHYKKEVLGPWDEAYIPQTEYARLRVEHNILY